MDECPKDRKDRIIIPAIELSDPESGALLYLSERISAGLSFASICPNVGDVFNGKKPTVLISGATAYHPDSKRPSVFIYDTYVSALRDAGATPLLALNITSDIELVNAYADFCSFLLLPGISHFAANEMMAERLRREEDPRKTRFDQMLYEAFRDRNKPVLGICLGLQMINVWEGGTLAHRFKEMTGTEHMLVSHMVNLRKNSFFSEIFGENIRVNSRHNDRIKDLAKGFNIDALSYDGTIEAISHKNKPIYAVQWHPERCQGKYREPEDGEDMGGLFDHFLCGKTFF